jgi:hypothetical protein
VRVIYRRVSRSTLPHFRSCFPALKLNSTPHTHFSPWSKNLSSLLKMNLLPLCFHPDTSFIYSWASERACIPYIHEEKRRVISRFESQCRLYLDFVALGRDTCGEEKSLGILLPSLRAHENNTTGALVCLHARMGVFGNEKQPTIYTLKITFSFQVTALRKQNKKSSRKCPSWVGRIIRTMRSR